MNLHKPLTAKASVENDKENLLDREDPESPKPSFECPDCGKVVTKKTVLRAHMRVHTGESAFLCKECGKGFLQGNDLRRHMRVHSGETPFHCPVCGRSFKVSLKQ